MGTDGVRSCEEEIIPKLVGTAAILILLLWKYFSGLIFIPAKMDAEKADKIARLSTVSPKPLVFEWNPMSLSSNVGLGTMGVHVRNASTSTIDDVRVEIISFRDHRWGQEANIPLGLRLATSEKETSVSLHPGDTKFFALVTVPVGEPEKMVVMAPEHLENTSSHRQAINLI